MHDPPFFENCRRLNLVSDLAAPGPGDAGGNLRVTQFLLTLKERWIFGIRASTLFNIRSISTTLPLRRAGPKIGRSGMRMNSRVDGLPGSLRECKRRAVYIIFSLSLAMAFPLPRAQGDERSGKDVVDAVCAECHATGVDDAPKIGDREAWSSRASQGLSTLTQHAIEGIRNMPAHGGDPDLGDLEMARAITYMVNQSGGNWIEPASTQDLATERSGAQVVRAQCAKCHAEGAGGAPRIGDTQGWVKRMKTGLPYLVASAIRGHGGMPPRGGQANLTDAELRSAIVYMYDPASAVARRPAAAAEPPPAEDTNAYHRVVDGVAIYLGVMAAEDLRALPNASPEQSMHGGIPKGSGYYHINVSLMDEKSRAPINDAQISMEFGTLGLRGARMALEPMLRGSGSYGIYVKPQPGDHHFITLHIKRPEKTRTVEATFEHNFFSG